MPAAKTRFHELLREAREKANQTAEVMALLLNMEEHDYRALERGDAYPDNETLKRLCLMMEWNYHDAQRMIINEMAAPGRASSGAVPAAGEGEQAMEALQSVPFDSAGEQPAGRPDTLGNRLRAVRERTGQSEGIIAMLLNVDPDTYRRLERGEPPTDELLRRISIVYDWNYYDLIALLRSEQARALHPRQLGSPYPGASGHQHRLQSLLDELERAFPALPEAQQQYLLAQLELIRDTARRHQHAS